MTGRAVALATDLAFDLQPAGWRLTDARGRRPAPRPQPARARTSTQVEEQTQGYAAAFKTQVAGPWTLAATVERPRGDRVLADHGARRELAQALAEGVRRHLADLRRRLPGVDRWVVQLDEPALPGVLAGGCRRPPASAGTGRCTRPRRARRSGGWSTRSATAGPSRGSTAAPPTPRSRCSAGRARPGWPSTSTGSTRPATTSSPRRWRRGRASCSASSPRPARRTTARVTERVHRWLDMLGLEPGPTLVHQPGVRAGRCATRRRPAARSSWRTRRAVELRPG